MVKQIILESSLRTSHATPTSLPFSEVTKLVGEGNAEHPENPKHILAYSVVRQIPKRLILGRKNGQFMST